eukprot:Skav206085  [mRNA]  locus=scaffold2150:89444:94665:+ [translate_table: standard]
MDFAAKTYVDGKYQGLPVYEERLFSVRAGQRTNIVARVLIRDDEHGHVCQSELYQQKFRFRGVLAEDTTDITLLNATVTHFRHPVLEVDAHGALLQHKARCARDFLKLAETCAGLGGLGVGASFAGWETMVQNDVQQSFTDHQSQYGTIPNVCGNICCLSTIQKMHEADREAAAMGWGYACQPFSRLGDGRQGMDERSLTLPFGLLAAYLLKKDLVVLECVPQAATSQFVQRCLQYHLDMIRGFKSEVILELSDVWVSRRRRYWTVITRDFMGKVSLQQFPKLPNPPTLGCVLPDFQVLPRQQFEELQLTDAELQAFTNYGKGIASQLVDLTAQGSTALHSWGNQVHQCACGCRPGLSQQRLQEHGLFGALVQQTDEDGVMQLRHVSPMEMSLMTGMVKKNGWHDTQRLLMAGIGQLASPLQAVWIFSQIRNHFHDMGLSGMTAINPKEALAGVVHALFAQRDECFAQPATCAMQVFQKEIDAFLLPGKATSITASQEDSAFRQAVALAEQEGPKSSSPVVHNHRGGAMHEQRKDGLRMPLVQDHLNTGVPEDRITGQNLQDEVSSCPVVHHQRGDAMQEEGAEGGHMPLVSNHQHDKEHDVRQPCTDVPPSSVDHHHRGGSMQEKRKDCLDMSLVQDHSKDECFRMTRPVVEQEHAHEPSGETCQSACSQMNAMQVPLVEATCDGPCTPSRDMPTRSEEPIDAHEPDVAIEVRSDADDDNESVGAVVTDAYVIEHDDADEIPDQNLVDTPANHGSENFATQLVEVQQAAKRDATRAGFPGDENTGALDAFRASRPHTGPGHEEAMSSANTKEALLLLKDILRGGVVLWDVAECQVTTFRQLNSTGPDMVQATQQLCHDEQQLYTTVGGLMADVALLPEDPLVLMGQPVATQVEDVQSLEYELAHMTRLEALIHQGGAVAVDEMTYYLGTLTNVDPANTKFQIVPPLVIDCLMDVQSISQQWIQAMSDAEQAASMILWHHHWIPVHATRKDSQWTVETTWEGVLAWDQLSTAKLPMTMTPTDALPSCFRFDCGFQAFAWLAAKVANTPLESMTELKASGWRKLYWQQLLMIPSLMPVRLGGHGELETALQALLKEHGVPQDRLYQRMQLVLKSIGNEKAASIFQAPRPWQMLKQFANACKPVVRLVQEDELQAVIKSKAKPKEAVASKKAGPYDRSRPKHVPPSDVHVPEGIFCQEGGEMLAQLMTRQFGTGIRGVVVISEPEVKPYLTQGLLSDGGLGFLVMAPFSEELAAQGEQVRFPASSFATGEPMLTTAVLLQKGAKKVYRNTPKQLHSVHQVANQAVKLVVYRDQIGMDWQDFTSQPVKHIIERFPMLSKCNKQGCACTAWHPSGEDKEGPILDLWQRDYVNLHFKKTKQAEAQMFVCCIRVVTSAFHKMFRLSGEHGVYIEPRAPDGRSQDPNFQTVWLGKQDIAGAKATQSILGEVSCLVRVQTRYGVKVPCDRAQAVHDKIKPDEPFFSGGTKQSFRVGPMPWGSTKQHLQALFSQWGWQARAVQPMGRAADHSGLMWLVFSNGDPPSFAFTLQHGDVVIHKDTSQTKQAWTPPQPQLSNTTLNKHRLQGDLEFDPWADAAAGLPSQKARQDMTQTHFAALEATIDQKVHQKFSELSAPSDEPMDGRVEDRLQMLEQQMTQMQQAQTSMQQQAGTFEQKLDYLNRQVETQAQQFTTALDTKMSEQMRRIETLLSKRKSDQE